MARKVPRRHAAALRRARMQGDRRYARSVMRDTLRAARDRRTERWLQVDCALFPQGGGRPPYVPWAELAEAIARWRADARFQSTFFMQKPPGLRLRFYGRRLESRLAPDLVSWLQLAERRDLIRGFRFSIYEPEVFRFGGPTGMEIAHAHFDDDSRIAMQVAARPSAERESLPASRFSVAATSDLIARCVEDRAEGWDIWQRLSRALGGSQPEAMADEELSRTRAAMLLTPAFLASLGPTSTRLVEEACASNAHIAARLHAALAMGNLHIGKRAWLAGVCIFHWNRLGLTTAELLPMVSAMDRLLSPHREPSS